jgi:hypothetical protein
MHKTSLPILVLTCLFGLESKISVQNVVTDRR